MSGVHKGVIGFITQKQSNIYFAGCPCHLLHIAETASKSLPITTKELLVDIYFYLDKSSKRYKTLQDIQVLCGKKTRKILEYRNTQ